MEEKTQLKPDELIGTRLAQYHINALIKQTSKSWVFSAEDLILERTIALKVLRPGQENKRQEQFLSEGKRLATLEEHENITTVYHAGESCGIHYIAMKLVEGQDLEDLINAGKNFSLEEILDISTDICKAINHATSRGLQHEDIKLANVKIKKDKSKRLYLIDFGGRLSESSKNDIRSVGLIAEQLLQHLKQKERVPKRFETLVQSAINETYPTAQEFLKAIGNYRRGISRRKFLMFSSVPVALLAAGASGYKYASYRKSIDFVVDNLKKQRQRYPENSEILKELSKRIFDKKIRRLAEGIIPNGKFPYAISSKRNDWNLTDGTYWTSGFWPGMLWLSFKALQDKHFKFLAYEWIKDMKFSERDNLTINPIRFFYSHSMGYNLIGDNVLRSTALESAEIISRRFNPNGKCLQTDGEINSSANQKIFIDAMTTALPLLIWDYLQTGNKNIREKIISHCSSTIKYNINPDGSTIQLILFDSLKNMSLGGLKSHGFDGDSCLSRGQARAIRGFSLAYQALENPQYLHIAEKCADYFIRNMPNDKVPFYDFKDPNDNAPKDSSAAAIGACGLLDLFGLTGNDRYEKAAIEILASLSTDYLSLDPNYQGLLMHGCSNRNNSSYQDSSLIYGDYDYLEALSRI